MRAVNALVALFAVSTLSAAHSQGAESPVILDVRMPAEYDQDHLVNAMNVDFLNSDFRARVAKLDKTKSYALYCRSGNRSGKAESMMKDLGFKNVRNVGSLKEASKSLKVACVKRPDCG